MADKTAVCVDCGQTDLRERMIKSPRGFVHTFTRRCQNTWQARAEAAEKRVTELESQLAAQAWRPVTEPPKNKDYSELFLWCDTQETAGGVGVIKFDGWFFNPVNYKPIERGYYMPIPPAPPQPTATEHPPTPKGRGKE